MKSLILSLTFAMAATSQAQAARPACQVPRCLYVKMSESDRAALRANEKTETQNEVTLTVVEGKIEKSYQVKMNTRGQSSIRAIRKNFAVNTVGVSEKRSKIKIGGEFIEESKIILSSMWQDYAYITNRIGYGMLALAGVPSLPTTYAEVFLNDQSQGLYLVSADPAKYAMKKLGADFVGRRRYFSKFEEKDAKDGIDTTPFFEAYESLYNDIKTNFSSTAASKIGRQIDLGQYFGWLAVNFMIGNSDYSDEVFFIAKSPKAGENIRFQIFPWDYDDVFDERMHRFPQNKGKSTDAQNTLLYNFEDRLDRRMENDEVLLAAYHDFIASALQSKFSFKQIDALFLQVWKELAPYTRSPGVLAQGSVDEIKKPYTPEMFQEAIQSGRAFIAKRRARMIEVVSDNVSPAEKKGLIRGVLSGARTEVGNHLGDAIGDLLELRKKK